MRKSTGEDRKPNLRVVFDRRVKLEFLGSRVTSDAGLLAFRDLDEALGLTEMADDVLIDTRTGRNGRHSLTAQLLQAVFGRLAGYEGVRRRPARARPGNALNHRWSRSRRARRVDEPDGSFRDGDDDR